MFNLCGLPASLLAVLPVLLVLLVLGAWSARWSRLGALSIWLAVILHLLAVLLPVLADLELWVVVFGVSTNEEAVRAWWADRGNDPGDVPGGFVLAAALVSILLQGAGGVAKALGWITLAMGIYRIVRVRFGRLGIDDA